MKYHEYKYKGEKRGAFFYCGVEYVSYYKSRKSDSV